MEATIVKIGTSLGVKVPEAVIKDFDLKVGTKIGIHFIQNGNFSFRGKSKNQRRLGCCICPIRFRRRRQTDATRFS